MSIANPPSVEFTEITAADIPELLERLGGVPARRVRLIPPPGLATEQDVLALHDHFNRLYELVDGTLVEKDVGYYESVVAASLIEVLKPYVRQRNLGVVAGEAGMMRLSGGLVRIPDVSFVSWSRLPGGRIPRVPVPSLAPDLAVEVLSEGNTRAEMERKTREYFEAGARLVWLIDPDTRTATVYTAPDTAARVSEDGSLDGGDVLPGFRLPLSDLFALAGPRDEE